MKYVKLGSTGLDVSRLCLGCMTFGEPDAGTHPWTLGEEASRPIIQRAVEQGINFSTRQIATQLEPPKSSLASCSRSSRVERKQ